MNQIQHILDQLQDTDVIAERLRKISLEFPDDEVHAINAEALKRRRADLERRLNAELRETRTDLVRYHVQRTEVDLYPVTAVAETLGRFQELLTAVFDSIRSTPKQRYRPAAENVELSTLNFAMALPVGSVVVSMSIENERLLAIRSDLDEAFQRVFEILKAREPEELRSLALEVGIASISRAHDWAAVTSQFGLDTAISISNEIQEPSHFEITKLDALTLKEAIEQKSDKHSDPEEVVGELVGIDIERPNTYFHIKVDDGRDLEGRLSDDFEIKEWAVHAFYRAKLLKVTTIKYATGEEKIDWVLVKLAPVVLTD